MALAGDDAERIDTKGTPMSDTTPFLKLLTGSFSTPAAGNPTGVMVEAAYAHHDIPARYINCDVASAYLADAVRGAVAMGWIGFNCSLPHKQTVIKYLDELGKSASLIGAANCVVRRGDRLIGENTDGQGFLTSLHTVADPQGTKITILGAGGAARAIAVELALAGAAEITIVNRNLERAEELAHTVNASTSASARPVPWTSTYAIPPETDILVNATSVGLAPRVDERLELAMDTLGSHLVVCDVIMNPPQTNLLRTAAARGATVLDGRGMLVNQAALNIWNWTGVRVDTAVLRSTLDGVL
jgi:shikimate dehydrogenase